MNYSHFDNKRILITGGAGFIGSCLVRTLVQHTNASLLVLDKLGHGSNLKAIPRNVCDVVQADLYFTDSIIDECEFFSPDIIIHLAAESHVDRSIDSPAEFIDSNVKGTFSILEAAHRGYEKMEDSRKANFRFHHVSTDEVYGSLQATGKFSEVSPYAPNSPYSASKAASDHLVRSWFHTYGLPVTTSNCSNNYGPWQADEKLIPTVIRSAVETGLVSLYGSGNNVRDWLYVQDHVDAILTCVERGVPGETYCVGAETEKTNVDIVFDIFDIMEELSPTLRSKTKGIRFVDDRPGHDFRYSIDPTKIKTELGWSPRYKYKNSLKRTVKWFLDFYGYDY